jgi:hypothetical protein
MIDVRYENPIRIYDISLNLIGEIDDYSSAYFTRSWYGAGDFSIQTNFNTVRAGDLQKGRVVMFGKDSYRCGVITKLEKKLDENGKGSQVVTASGYEIPFVFSGRIILPTAGSDVFNVTNSAETVMKSLVTAQCGSGADVDRRFTGLTIATDIDRGATYVLNARYNTTVLDELKKIALATDVGYFIRIDENTKTYVFDISTGLDRTATQTTNPRAIFSDNYDTIKSANYSSSDNQYRNYAYVAGQGAGINRVVREVFTTTTEPTGFDRKEIYVDARDLSTNADLDARGGQKLGELNIQTTVNGMPLTYSPLVYRTDYDLGDLCTVDVYDEPYDARITSVKESWAPLTYTIDVVFDKEPASISSQVSSAVESVRSTLSQTENSESGSNANGWWKKDADGTLTQWGKTDLVTQTWSPFGSLYSGLIASVTFPVNFIDTNYAYSDSAISAGNSAIWIGQGSTYAVGSVSRYPMWVTNTVVTVGISWIAIGRWK